MSRLGAAIGTGVFLVWVPGLVAGVGPWLVSGYRLEDGFGDGVALRALGGVLIASGLVVVLSAFTRFVVEGIGTPAPVAPTEKLVVGGLYRHVRNPMYLAVGATIVGQALLFGQPGLLVYAAIFFALVVAFVYGYEQPVLAERFGAAYEEYKRAVPAWLPRLRGWQPPAG
jgi:protein-S-isoprenylcysteine O-methyltransferase Ste14